MRIELKRIFHFIFNMNNFMKELYEENFCYFVPCYEIKYELIKNDHNQKVMKVLLLSKYTKLGASSRLRSYQYLTFLKHHGIEVDVEPLFDSSYLHRLYQGKKKNIGKILFNYFNRIRCLLRAKKFDLIWIEYEIFPWLPAIFENIPRHRSGIE